MDPVVADALAGTLCSSGATTNQQDTSISNASDVDLTLYWLSPTGTQCGYDKVSGTFAEGLPGYVLGSGDSAPLADVPDGTYFLLRAAHSGAFAAVVTKEGTPPGSGFVVDCGSFLDPGVAGPVPKPTQDRPIPVDSPRVLVGCGSLANGATVAREQYWHLTADSYSLAPGETVTTSLTQTSGMESTSSDQTTLSASLNVSASAGWGPVSASVSAALSRSSTTFQQVTVSEQQTAFRSLQRTNGGDSVATFFVWQLIDVVTIFASDGRPEGSIVTGVQPVVIDGPYPPPSALPLHELRARSTPEMRAASPRLLLEAAPRPA